MMVTVMMSFFFSLPPHRRKKPHVYHSDPELSADAPSSLRPRIRLYGSPQKLPIQ